MAKGYTLPETELICNITFETSDETLIPAGEHFIVVEKTYTRDLPEPLITLKHKQEKIPQITLPLKEVTNKFRIKGIER